YYWLDAMEPFFTRMFTYKGYDEETCVESEATVLNRGVYKYSFEEDEDYYEFNIDKQFQINLSYELGEGERFEFRIFDTSATPTFDVPSEKK
ncbi:MAG: hypothetical protein K5765_01885, partial [Clostridia bacterium]|nr:hypothetical protein [Clostridia bacterium]